MDQALLKALEKFAELLDRRIQHGVPTSERAVLYTFCYALMKELGFRPEEMILEAKHGLIRNAKIDLLIRPFSGTHYAVECKYDQHLLEREYSESNQRAGKKF